MFSKTLHKVTIFPLQQSVLWSLLNEGPCLWIIYEVVEFHGQSESRKFPPVARLLVRAVAVPNLLKPVFVVEAV